jgi:putative inorganic carbon (HCO3(-)) transporter
MNVSTVRSRGKSRRGSRFLLLGVIVLGAIMVFSAVTVGEPSLAAAGILALVLVLAVARWPSAPVLVVLFIIYTNAAAVAVQFHGVPFIIGAAAPLLLAVPLAHALVVKRERLIFNPVLFLMFLFFGIQLMAAVFAVELNFEELLTFAIEGLGLYFLVLNTVRTPNMLRYAVWAIVIAGLAVGGLVVFQELTGSYDNDFGGFAQTGNAFGTGEEDLQGEITQTRLGGSLGKPNRFAQIMVMLVPLAMFRFWGERRVAPRLIAAVAVVLISAAAMLTFSRGAIVAYALMIVALILVRQIKIYQLAILLLGLLLAVTLVPNVGGRLVKLSDLSPAGFVSDEQSGGIESADSSTKSRVTQMMAAVLMFADHPITGIGPGMYPRHYQEYARIVGLKVKTTDRQSHFLYGGVAAETGIFGFITFCLIIFVTMRDLWRTRTLWKRERPEYAHMATGIMLAIFTYLITGIFLHFAYIRFFWIIMGIAGAAVHIYQGEAGRLPWIAESKAKHHEGMLTVRHTAS